MAHPAGKTDPKFTRSMLVLLPLAAAYRQRGGDIEAILTAHGIPLRALAEPAMLIEAAACYAAMESMADALGDPHFGAGVAIEVAGKGSPAMRDAAAHAVTFGDFLSRMVVEVAGQVDNVRYTLSASPEAACLANQRAIRVAGSTVQLDAIGVCFHVTLMKRGLGDAFDPDRIVVTAPTTEGVPPDFLPKRTLIRSGVNGLQISFPPEWLWAPFSLGWRFEDMPRGEFGSEDGQGAIAHFSKVIEEHVVQEDLSLERFADIVGLHPRRVQRILSARKTSFSKIKDDVRRGIAVDLLRNSTASIADIASHLGFSAPSAFDRAFRQWTGKTPSQVRNASSPE